MTVQIGLVALASLMAGLAAGYTLARLRRGAVAAGLDDPNTVDEETRPTLIPFRATRDSGRNLAQLDKAAAATKSRGGRHEMPGMAEEPDDQLDELLADLDKRR
jgi:hypothetical protein